MKIFSSLLLTTALVFSTATAASAYHLSPIDSKIRLKGTLTFYPGGQAPFTCKVVFDLKTRGNSAEIKSAKFPSGNTCGGVVFGGFPWFVGVDNATSGEFGTVSFTGGGGGCSQEREFFNDNSSGIWTLPANGQCLSGTLKSIPPATIVP